MRQSEFDFYPPTPIIRGLSLTSHCLLILLFLRSHVRFVVKLSTLTDITLVVVLDGSSLFDIAVYILCGLLLPHIEIVLAQVEIIEAIN